MAAWGQSLNTQVPKAEETPKTDDPEHDAKVTAGRAAIDQDGQKYLEDGKISRENAQ